LQHNLLENEDICKIIAKNIRKYRKLKGITQKQLADITGYSYAYIRRVESMNYNNNYSILTLYNICIALDIEISSLFDNKDI